MYVVDIWPTGVVEGRAVREEPREALCVHSLWVPPTVLPSTGVKADGFFQCLTTLVVGGAGSGNVGPVIWKLNLVEGLQYLSTSNHGSSILSNMNPLKPPNMVALLNLQCK